MTARTLAGTSAVPVKTVDPLREIVPGDLSVLTSTSTTGVARFLRRRSALSVDPATRWDSRYPGGETYRGWRDRVWSFFAALIGRADWRRVIVGAP